MEKKLLRVYAELHNERIALTADAFTSDIAKADAYGMNGHLSKPIDPN